MILIQENLNEMLILVYLHIPSLRSKFDPFYTEVADSMNTIQKYKDGSVDTNKYVKEISKSIEANLNFRREIEKLVKQKGYGYF